MSLNVKPQEQTPSAVRKFHPSEWNLALVRVRSEVHEIAACLWYLLLGVRGSPCDGRGYVRTDGRVMLLLSCSCIPTLTSAQSYVFSHDLISVSFIARVTFLFFNPPVVCS